MTNAMTTTSSIVVLGGGYAGLLCATRLARKLRGTGVQVTLVNASDTFCERVRLHQLTSRTMPIAKSLRAACEASGIALVVGFAERIELETRRILVRAPAGILELPFDRLVYALGSRTDRDAIPGAREHAFTLDDVASSTALATKLEEATEGARVLVIGGGLTGVEAATEIAETHPHLSVTLVSSKELLPGHSMGAREHAAHVLERLRVTTLEHRRVTAIEGARVETEDGELAADIVVLTAGFCVSDVARRSGLAVDDRGRLLVDRALHSVSHPFVVGAGDAVGGAVSLRMACATAMPLGAHAADVLVREFRGLTPEPFTFRFLAICVSLGRHDGLVEMVHADDRPRGFVLTGRLAAWMKETIVRYTVWSLDRERRATYRWPKGALPASRYLPA